MKKLLIKLAVNAAAIWVTTLVIDGINVGGNSTVDRVVTLLVVTAIFGVVNTVLRPIVKLFAFPAYIFTLGLITFLINALMLWITAWISERAELAFTVDQFFWDAVLGALLISFVSFILNLILPDGD